MIGMDLRSCTEKECIELAVSLSQKPFRGKQLFEWIHKKQAESVQEMTNLPAAFREQLEKQHILSGVTELARRVSGRGDTAKYLFGLSDGSRIESVWMKYRHGNSVCISSQVGCRMGCRFCASTLSGLARDLTPGEMLSQVYEIQRSLGERISHVIVMGMGEPLDNYQNLIKFIRLLSDPKLQITLAISLHAPNDEVRKKIMPVANRYSMDEIFDVCRDYVSATGRRITFEYSMIRGVNDSARQAAELARRCSGLNCHVNLIPLNEVSERDCRRSAHADIANFKNVLEKNGINVTIRREMGSDIEAACGQLRRAFDLEIQ